jgi:hypothetical protein
MIRAALFAFALFLLACAFGAMTGVWYFCRWLVTGINDQFGYGVAVGSLLMLVLLWSADRWGLNVPGGKVRPTPGAAGSQRLPHVEQ